MSAPHDPEATPAGDLDILEELKAEVAADLEDERPPHAGPTTQVVAALVAAGIGVFGLVASWSYGLGQLTHPGPGLWPFTVSVIITVLSIGLLVTGRHATDTEKFTRPSLLAAYGVVTLVGLALLLPIVGFEVPSLLLMLIWTRFLGHETWRSSIVVSILTVAAFYALFVLALAIPVPRLI